MDKPPPPGGRILVLDILRGIALLGMFVVHFNDHASYAGGAHAGYQKVLALFFRERFLTMFGILFGVSFAIQFQRAEARGDTYIVRYLRRIAGLAITLLPVLARGFFGDGGGGLHSYVRDPFFLRAIDSDDQRGDEDRTREP